MPRRQLALCVTVLPMSRQLLRNQRRLSYVYMRLYTRGTGLPVEESVRMREVRDKWRKYVLSVANRRIEDG